MEIFWNIYLVLDFFLNIYLVLGFFLNIYFSLASRDFFFEYIFSLRIFF